MSWPTSSTLPVAQPGYNCGACGVYVAPGSIHSCVSQGVMFKTPEAVALERIADALERLVAVDALSRFANEELK